MSTVSVEVVRESISIITKILSGKGIKVTQSGTQAYVESSNGIPSRVNIPFIPDNASDELILAINGFLDHEVAHVLFTDFKSSTQDKFKNKTVFSIYNAIEDCRIEKEMRKKFAGSKTNLDGVSSFFLDKYVHPEYENALSSEDAQSIASSLFVAAVRAWSGQPIFIDYMKDKWAHIKPLTDQIEKAIPNISRVTSTSDAVKLAHIIYDLMTDNKKNDKKGGEGETPEDKGIGIVKKTKSPVTDEDGESEDNESKGEESLPSEADEDESETEEKSREEDHEDEGESNDESEQDESSDEHDDSSESDSQEDSDENDDQESEQSDGGEDQELGQSDDPTEDDDGEEALSGETGDEESDDNESGDSSSDGSESDEMEEVVVDLRDMVKPPEKSGMSESVAKVISDDAVTSSRGLEYRIFSTDFDKVDKFDVEKHGRASARKIDKKLVAIEEEVRKLSGPLQKTLERLVKAKDVVRNIPGKRSGRVNPSSLFRLKTGDDRVFRQRDVGISSEVAVSLVVDCSGSMSGNKMNVAMESAFALCDVLTKIGVSNEIIGFTTLGGDDMENMEREIYNESSKFSYGERPTYSRHEPIFMPIFKGFDERFGIEQKRRIASASTSGDFMRNNIDGESIRIAAKRLVSLTKEKGKQMIVLSDGSPAGYGNAREINSDMAKAVLDVQRMGVKVIGIGIMDKSVEKFYENHIVINNVQQLPSLIIKELRELLL